MSGELPPITAWLRAKPWGRDIQCDARGEFDRIQDFRAKNRMGLANDDMILGYLDHHSFDEIVGRAGSRMRELTEEQVYLMFATRPFERDVADMLHDHVSDEARSYSIGPDMTARLEGGEGDPETAEGIIPHFSVYVAVEGSGSRALDGKPLAGILATYYGPEDDEDDGDLYISPLSNEIPVRGALTPHIGFLHLPLERDGTLADAIRASAPADAIDKATGEILEDELLADSIREGVDADDEQARLISETMVRITMERRPMLRDTRELVLAEAPVWARLLAGAFAAIREGRPGARCYPAGAPADLVAKATSGGTGARKAQQKLVALGWPPLIRFEDGQERVEREDPIAATPIQTDAEDRAAVAAPATTRKAPVRGDKKAQRKAARLARKSSAPAPTPVEDAAIRSSDGADAGVDGTTVAAAAKPTETDPAIEQDDAGQGPEHGPEQQQEPAPALPTWRHDDELLEKVDAIIGRSLKDLPALGSRSWESSLPAALAAMNMRRMRVAQAHRESYDAARRRVAAGILDRFAELPDYLSRLRREEAENPGKRRAHAIARPSVIRAIDPDVVAAAAHPLHVVVSDDAELSAMLMFPGVEGRDDSHQERTTIVRAWREGTTLHLDGIVSQGCLCGLRRLEFDLVEGGVTAFDAEADDTDTQTLSDLLYSALADAVLGPVDEIDAWMHRSRSDERDEPRRRQDPHVMAQEGAGPDDGGERQDTGRAPGPVSDEDYLSWEAASSEVAPLSEEQAQRLSDLLSTNAVARTLLQIAADGVPATVRHALVRHLSAVAADPHADVVALREPQVADEADLAPFVGHSGVVVVTDRGVFDHAQPSLVPETQNRERPVALLYRIHDDGMAALLVQVDADARTTFARWARAELHEEDGDDLSWYLRGVVALALAPAPQTEVVDEAASATLPHAPGVRRGEDASREGPRRLIAQVRLRPGSMAHAVTVVSQWFDQQAARHGDDLVEDRRDAGEWTLEHRSRDKGFSAHWSVTVRIPDEDSHVLDVLVRTTLATGVKPRLPTIVRDIAAATPTEAADGLLRVAPPHVSSHAELHDLVRRLQSPERVLPILVMTPDAGGEYVRSPQTLARQALGAMTVVTISDEMTFEMSDLLGQDYRTFGGAVRLFHPRFDPDADAAARHPRILPDAGVERQLNELISRATAATVTRYHITDQARPASAAPAREPAQEARSEQADLPFDDAPAAPAPTPLASIRPAAEVLAPRIVAPVVVPRPVVPTPRPIPTITRPERGKPSVASEAERRVDAIGEIPASPAPAPTPDAPVAETQPKSDQDANAGTTRPVDQAQEVATPPGDQPAPAADEPHRQTSMPDLDIRRAVSEAVAEQLAAMRMPDMMAQIASVVARLDGFDARTGDDAALARRDAEIASLQDELRAERETMTQLLDEAEAQRVAAQEEVATLRQALNERRRGADAAAVPAWPTDLSGLSEWLERNVLPNVVVTSKAYRAMRRVRYTDMERLCRTLQLLDGPYIDLLAGEKDARVRWEAGLKELRLESKVQTRMGMSIRGGAEYSFQHEGQRYDMTRHLRGVESVHNEHDRLLRIYFHYDKDNRRVLIGHMPTHLTTIDS